MSKEQSESSGSGQQRFKWKSAQDASTWALSSDESDLILIREDREMVAFYPAELDDLAWLQHRGRIIPIENRQIAVQS